MSIPPPEAYSRSDQSVSDAFLRLEEARESAHTFWLLHADAMDPNLPRLLSLKSTRKELLAFEEALATVRSQAQRIRDVGYVCSNVLHPIVVLADALAELLPQGNTIASASRLFDEQSSLLESAARSHRSFAATPAGRALQRDREQKLVQLAISIIEEAVAAPDAKAAREICLGLDGSNLHQINDLVVAMLPKSKRVAPHDGFKRTTESGPNGLLGPLLRTAFNWWIICPARCNSCATSAVQELRELAAALGVGPHVTPTPNLSHTAKQCLDKLAPNDRHRLTAPGIPREKFQYHELSLALNQALGHEPVRGTSGSGLTFGTNTHGEWNSTSVKKHLAPRLRDAGLLKPKPRSASVQHVEWTKVGLEVIDCLSRERTNRTGSGLVPGELRTGTGPVRDQ